MNVVPLSQLERFTTGIAKALLNARVELMKLGVPSEIKEVKVTVMVVDDDGLNAIERRQDTTQPQTIQTTEKGSEKQTHTTTKEAATGRHTQTTEPVTDRQSQGFGRTTATEVHYTS